jgi:hypothetical protein
VTVLVIATGICAAGVLFLLRFLIALCQESEAGNAVHLLRVTPAPTGRNEPDGGDEEESLNLGNSHTLLRNRRSRHTPAATTARWSAMEAASSAKAKRHSANHGRYSA